LYHQGVRLFKKLDDIDMQVQGAATIATDPLRSSLPQLISFREKLAEWREYLTDVDWVPDLGVDIGSPAWFRGLVTLAALCGFAISALPDFGPIAGHRADPLSGYRA
jgi:hypothetical protein